MSPAQAPDFVAARLTFGGPRHAVRNVPSQFHEALPASTPRKRTLLRAACGVGYSGLWIDQTEDGETVPWGKQSLFHNCPACVRRVGALSQEGLVR